MIERTDELEKMKVKLTCLRREENEHHSKASVCEAVDVLIQCCELLLHLIDDRNSHES